MTKQEEAVGLLRALRGANVTYKAFAQTAGIKLDSLYTWIQRQNMTDEKAEYIINAVKHYYPVEYEIINLAKKHS